MNMVRLIYVSRMTDACDTQALQDILKTSRLNNASKDITGMLCYDPTFFLQCLEGPREEVNALYTTIQNDERHTDVMLLEYADVETRLFGIWNMAFILASEVDKQVLNLYAHHKKFDPYMLNANTAREFLLHIVKAHEKQLAEQMD